MTAAQGRARPGGKNLLTVGITGRSGSGKSTVSAYYRSLGYPVADGDAITREIYLPSSDCLKELAAAFGADILHADGTLNRKLLGERAFASKQSNARLVAITHPYIIKRFFELADAAAAAGARLFFLDGAMIVGGPVQPWCDYIVVVNADEATLLARITARDGIGEGAAKTRLAAQPGETALREAADYVIENDGTPDVLIERAGKVLGELARLVASEEGVKG